MNYQQTIDYLYSILPMFSRVGTEAYKKDLTNIRKLCEAWGHPEKSFPSIHIAGTNGKGSVSHMLASVLQASGYRTGLYTSPHLYDFRERIRIDGVMVPEDFVIDFTRRVQPLIDSIQPSFFEITVLMAFEWFRVQKVDIAVIETGLGGRLDSTNIIEPLLSVITNIGMDHMNILGDSLSSIAFEKAGIIKPGTPVVIGELLPETRPVFEEAARNKNAPIHYAQRNYRVVKESWSDEYLTVDVRDNKGMSQILSLDLTGVYQIKNVVTVLESLSLLKKWKIPQAAIATGLSQVKSTTGLHGRWEELRSNPKVVLEVAHNREGVQAMMEHIARQAFRRLHLVMGFVKDKDPAAVLQLLPKDASYYFTQAQMPRALPSEELKSLAHSYHLHGDAYANVNQALEAAMKVAEKDDLIVVCGSIFVVAEVKPESVAQRT